MQQVVREGAIDLTEMFDDIEVPSLEVPDLDDLSSNTTDKSKDLFEEK